jgi:heat shock protein HtpX
MLWIGQALAGQSGLIMALIFAGIMNLCTYWFSERMVLRMYGAQEMSEVNAPGFHDIVREIAIRGDLPTPKLYLIPDEAPNAFATGRNPAHSSVAVTEGLIRMPTKNEFWESCPTKGSVSFLSAISHMQAAVLRFLSYLYLIH